MLIKIANLLVFNDFRKAVLSIIHAEGYYWNSQHVYSGFTMAFDQSDSLTHPCHVRISFYIKFMTLISLIVLTR